MRYTEGKKGRIFVLRLEDKEIIQPSIESFAQKMNIRAAQIQMLGGVDKGSKLIVGPEEGRSDKIVPMVIELDEMHEAVGNGTLFPDVEGTPRLHCHLVCGRKEKTLCGEIREGVIVWHVMEVIITEISDCDAQRLKDETTGFELLYPQKDKI
jgi:predicted DNA-binding protein with PD1-like motif